MSSLFDDLKEGLKEAIDFEKGNSGAKTVAFEIETVKKIALPLLKNVNNESTLS